MADRRRLCVLVMGVVIVAGVLALSGPRSPGDLSALADSLGAAAPVSLLVAWIVLTPALFPGTVLAAAAGLLLGPAEGTLISVTGALLGSVAAFTVARAGGGDAARRLGGPRVHGLRERLERRGFLSVLVLRAAPGVPATVLNYAAGLSRVRPAHFAAAVALAGTPRVVAYTLLGGASADLTSAPAIAAVAMIAAMSVGTPLALLVARRRRAWSAARQAV
jgi:uncharacterized membrane protein YdjX (TVP38/TMEM64 family)